MTSLLFALLCLTLLIATLISTVGDELNHFGFHLLDRLHHNELVRALLALKGEIPESVPSRDENRYRIR